MWKRQGMLFAGVVCVPLFAIMAVWVVVDQYARSLDRDYAVLVLSDRDNFG